MTLPESLALLLGNEHASRVANAHVLVVGAGGIGCELIKNLALLPVAAIDIVDLDTIDVTNLNRQFLFHRKHVGMSKAEVARDSALGYNPAVNITSTHGNIITDPRFTVPYFGSFQLVFNALDNLAARRHVNLMCVAAGVPLVDAGTGGYRGQSCVHWPKAGLECYECTPKATPKTFPVCTIRSTPSVPIHCIVWAKDFLFPLLFGEDPNAAAGSDTMHDDTDNAAQVEELAREATALAHLRSIAATPEFAHSVLEKVYMADIARVASMADMWRSREPPIPLAWTAEMKAEVASATTVLAAEGPKSWERRVLTVPEVISVLCECTADLGSRFVTTGSLSFDKDDAAAMRFVAAAATLRQAVYAIQPLKSFFELKSMAGNIVPIVATTNATIAGAMVHQFVGIMHPAAVADIAQSLTNPAHAFTATRLPPMTMGLASTKSALLSRVRKLPREDACGVCSRAYVCVRAALDSTAVGELLAWVVAQTSGALTVDNVAVSEGSRLLYDPDMEENLERSLGSLGVKYNQFLTVAVFDADDDPRAAEFPGTMPQPVVVSVVAPEPDDMQGAIVGGVEMEVVRRVPRPAPLVVVPDVPVSAVARVFELADD
ncbi:hypothetical protein BC828DRAFT_384645 [Blastocladiella britannica]|nr:hypothetical protein BC828DRAFT_384645 [Blastocladiella britannica]